MLYLSQLSLNPRSPYARGDLADCAALHRRVLQAFPDRDDITGARDHYGVLYRLERSSGGPQVLVQSRAEPDWSRLPAGYLREPVAGPKRVDALYAGVTAGQRLRFRLRANPTRRISDHNTEQGDRWRGKRVDLRQEDEQLAWLKRKGEKAGFVLEAARVQPESAGVDDVVMRQGAMRVMGTGHNKHLIFGSVVFEGRLRVTEPIAFQQALEQGLGSGKAFGFGLLSVAPAGPSLSL